MKRALVFCVLALGCGHAQVRLSNLAPFAPDDGASSVARGESIVTDDDLRAMYLYLRTVPPIGR